MLSLIARLRRARRTHRGITFGLIALVALTTGVALAEATFKCTDVVSSPNPCPFWGRVVGTCCNWFNGANWQRRSCHVDVYLYDGSFYHKNAAGCGNPFGGPCGPNIFTCPPP